MIDTLISSIQPIDTSAMELCQIRVDNLTKPLGSLHSLEHLAVKLSGIFRLPRPQSLHKAVLVFAADHGVATAGVSAYPGNHTGQLAQTILAGGAAINALADHAAAPLYLIDIGLQKPLQTHPALRSQRVAAATGDITVEPAMTRRQAYQAMVNGAGVVQELVKHHGINAFALGDIGVAGTTASTAVIAALTGQSAHQLTGRGSGITDAVFNHKVSCVEQALHHHQLADTSDPLAVLTAVGGLELAALSGAMIAAAANQAAVVLDGVTTAAAALVAASLAPKLIPYLIGSHYSLEPAQRAALDRLGIPAYLQLKLGCGSAAGAALGLTLLDASLHMLNDMKTFGEAAVAVAENGPGAVKQRSDIR